MSNHTTWRVLLLSITCLCLLPFSNTAEAAVLKLNPNTGVYSAGKSFTVSIVLNTEGKPVNAADGQLSFSPQELQVVSISRASSIFNLWTEEPSFSNARGTITFSGGSPSGYKGASGSIAIITFKSLGAGTPKVTFSNGSALAADGMGTNVLTAMNGGTYTIVAESASPAPEYIPPANTPKAPVVTSSTHSDESVWYKEKNANLAWTLPDDVTAVRVILDDNAGTVPTKVYDEPITEKTIEDLPEGMSYFHIQFKNNEGWGKITHFKLSVDTETPKNFVVSEEDKENLSNPKRVLVFTAEDTSPLLNYRIQIDGKDPLDFKDLEQTGKYILDQLLPGYHTITVEAFDSAGNSTVASYSLTVSTFEKPIFIDYPTRVNTEVIPAIKGKTRPQSSVAITVSEASGARIANADEGARTYTVTSDDSGEFVFIPDGPFTEGVYVIRAIATDSFGSMSEESDEIRLIVEVPEYVAIGSVVVSILSVLVPAVSLILVLLFGTWYLWHKLIVWKRKVRKETLEAEERLTLEFDGLMESLHEHVTELKESRKNKLTKAESELIAKIENDLSLARKKIGKEIEDIEGVIK